MAERTEGTVTIEAPPATIMGVIADFESYPDWAEIKGVEIRRRDAQGRADRVWFEVAAGPVTARYELEYAYEPDDRGVSWRFVEGSGVKDLEGEYVLEPDGDATKVTYRLRADIPIPGPGFLKRKLLAEGEKRIIDTALKGLKKRVESM